MVKSVAKVVLQSIVYVNLFFNFVFMEYIILTKSTGDKIFAF